MQLDNCNEYESRRQIRARIKSLLSGTDNGSVAKNGKCRPSSLHKQNLLPTFLCASDTIQSFALNFLVRNFLSIKIDFDFLIPKFVISFYVLTLCEDS